MFEVFSQMTHRMRDTGLQYGRLLRLCDAMLRYMQQQTTAAAPRCMIVREAAEYFTVFASTKTTFMTIIWGELRVTHEHTGEQHSSPLSCY